MFGQVASPGLDLLQGGISSRAREPKAAHAPEIARPDWAANAASSVQVPVFPEQAGPHNRENQTQEGTTSANEQPATERLMTVRFTASGSEYFRIWIVNLLLTVVTLGFYLPFAKARRLRYFYANTLVDGQPLAFHGDAWKMFRGYVLMLIIFGAYALSSYVSNWVSLGAFVVLAVLWPALWRSSLMFRLGNTSWRGLRMAFEGTLGDAYRAMLPLFVPGLLILAVTAWYMTGVDPKDEPAVKAANESMLPYMGAATLLLAALTPWAMWRIKRYQHGGYRYAQEAARFSGRAGSFYLLGLKLLLVGVLALAVLGVGAGMAFAMMKTGQTGLTVHAVALSVPFALLAWIAFSWLTALAAAGLQNLAWNHTQSPQLRFSSALRVRTLTWLKIKNMLLVIVTLGLYRPFAVVSVARLHLQAVEAHTSSDVDAWLAHAGTSAGTGSGEMSGDFFGIDVGL
jgi:uncharacterized membrane protein YjgN (DUF898 family)